jgi:hypothetical protein
MPDTDEETTEELKLINDINLKSLADGFAKVLGQHVGGTFDVTLKKFEQTRSSVFNEFEIVITVSRVAAYPQCSSNARWFQATRPPAAGEAGRVRGAR